MIRLFVSIVMGLFCDSSSKIATANLTCYVHVCKAFILHAIYCLHVHDCIWPEGMHDKSVNTI